MEPRLVDLLVTAPSAICVVLSLDMAHHSPRRSDDGIRSMNSLQALTSSSDTAPRQTTNPCRSKRYSSIGLGIGQSGKSTERGRILWSQYSLFTAHSFVTTVDIIDTQPSSCWLKQSALPHTEPSADPPTTLFLARALYWPRLSRHYRLKRYLHVPPSGTGGESSSRYEVGTISSSMTTLSVAARRAVSVAHRGSS